MRMVNLNSHSVCKQSISNMAFCGDMVGGLQQEASALVGFQCFDREGWSQQFPQEGQEVLATRCALLHHIHRKFLGLC